MVLKIIDYLNDCESDTFDIDIKALDGGKLKCHFDYTVELPEE